MSKAVVEVQEKREKVSWAALVAMFTFVLMVMIAAGALFVPTESSGAGSTQSIETTTSTEPPTTTTTVDWVAVATYTEGIQRANEEALYAELQRQEDERVAAEAAAKKQRESVTSAPKAESSPAPAKSYSTSGIPDEYWYRMADCETGGNWAHYPEGTWSGGLGIARVTWEGFGGLQYASNAGYATPQQQIAVANNIASSVGLSGWGCLRVVGYP